MNWFGVAFKLISNSSNIQALWTKIAPLIPVLQKIWPQLQKILSEIAPELSGSVPAFDVKWLQTELNKQSNAGLVVDGSYGELTRKAVENWQRAAGFAPEDIDGWAGVQTTAAIYEKSK